MMFLLRNSPSVPACKRYLKLYKKYLSKIPRNVNSIVIAENKTIPKEFYSVHLVFWFHPLSPVEQEVLKAKFYFEVGKDLAPSFKGDIPVNLTDLLRAYCDALFYISSGQDYFKNYQQGLSYAVGKNSVTLFNSAARKRSRLGIGIELDWMW